MFLNFIFFLGGGARIEGKVFARGSCPPAPRLRTPLMYQHRIIWVYSLHYRFFFGGGGVFFSRKLTGKKLPGDNKLMENCFVIWFFFYKWPSACKSMRIGILHNPIAFIFKPYKHIFSFMSSQQPNYFLRGSQVAKFEEWLICIKVRDCTFYGNI